MKRRLFCLLSLLCACLLLCAACGSASNQTPQEVPAQQDRTASTSLESEAQKDSSPADSSEEGTDEPESKPESESEPEPDPKTEPESESESEPEASPEEPEQEASNTQPTQPAQSSESSSGRLIAIDAGHQAQSDRGKEPLGPGSTEMKTRVASGTQGVSTGTPEYELTLAVALQLQAELENRGYQVLMIRTENDVSISNAERAEMANEAGADALIRIHADGVDDSSVHGASTLCMTASNPYNASLYDQSKRLSKSVVDGLCAATGAKNRGVQETDNMTGINWSQVPVTIVEMGFMSNPEEDERMAEESYQAQIVSGIADGLDNYFKG